VLLPAVTAYVLVLHAAAGVGPLVELRHHLNEGVGQEAGDH
jgi:hypothetical protein